jgi:hypothetical protein
MISRVSRDESPAESRLDVTKLAQPDPLQQGFHHSIAGAVAFNPLVTPMETGIAHDGGHAQST